MMPTGLPLPYEAYDWQADAVAKLRAKAEGERRTALAVVPTGGGKTPMMGFYLVEEMPVTAFPKVLVLQHTGTLMRQNRSTISELTAGIGAATSVVKGRSDDWSGDIVFGSVATVAKPGRLRRMPVVTHILIDEAHRAGAAGYKRIVKAARRANRWVKVVMFTATPNRADGEPIATIEDLAFQITYAELIDRGVLVPVTTRTIDLGLRAEMDGVGIAGDDYDMATLGQLLNKRIHHAAVYEHWIEQGGRERNGTAGFCPSVAHAEALAETFRRNGVNAAVVHGDMREEDVDRVLDEYEAGRHQVLLACQMLTEGWNSPRTDCLLNLRMMAAELTWLQAVGRGMRAHPGKTDCLLLDFAGAAVRHGTIETRVLHEREARVRAETTAHPANDNSPFHLDRKPAEVIRHFAMREIDIMRQSKPRFVAVPAGGGADEASMVACHSRGWAGVFQRGGMWHVATRLGELHPQVSACVTANEAMAMADRFLLSLGPPSRRKFEEMEPTHSQRLDLRRFLIDDPAALANRYAADCHLAAARARGALRRAMTVRSLPMAA